MTSPMQTAHELARREMSKAKGREFYGTCANCFADQLRAVYATIKYEKRMDAQFGAGMRPAFITPGPAMWD